jgi:hypothetical protein
LEGKRREGKAKKEETREVWEGRSLKGYFFFITQKSPNLRNSKIVLDGVWRVCVIIKCPDIIILLIYLYLYLLYIILVLNICKN